jgi:hypothetical protein
MKKHYIINLATLFLLISIIFTNFMISKELKLIKEIRVDSLKSLAKEERTAVEIYTSGKKLLYRGFSIKLCSYIENQLSDFSDMEKNNLVIEFINADNESILCSYSDFNAKVINLPPLLILNKYKSNLCDTITINDVKGTKGKIDCEQIDNEMGKALVNRIYLNIKTIPKEEINSLFSENSLIFTQDKSDERWKKNIKTIKIYFFH